MRLTPKQRQLVQFIRTFTRTHGYAPTLDEMAEEFGVSKVTIYERVRRLEELGALRRQRRRARSVEVVETSSREEETSPALPLVGTIAAGEPLEALQVVETIDLSTFLNIDAETFLLRVRGDSMIDEHIRDGDYVIVRRTSTARDGQTVVALLPDGEATLKKFYREKGRIRLQPANPDLKPIYLKEVQIQGVVIGVLRKY